jgi:hypothetical protein
MRIHDGHVSFLLSVKHLCIQTIGVMKMKGMVMRVQVTILNLGRRVCYNRCLVGKPILGLSPMNLLPYVVSYVRWYHIIM